MLSDIKSKGLIMLFDPENMGLDVFMNKIERVITKLRLRMGFPRWQVACCITAILRHFPLVYFGVLSFWHCWGVPLHHASEIISFAIFSGFTDILA